jgi:hypothetical protein
MGGLRDLMQRNPMVGWAVAGVLMLVAAFVAVRRFARPSETAELTQMVTIRCTETGDEWQVPRGVMEKELYLRPLPLDPGQGLVNPKTGRATGFPVDSWKETIQRITVERGGDAGAAPNKAGKGAPGAPPVPSAPAARPG